MILEIEKDINEFTNIIVKRLKDEKVISRIETTHKSYWEIIWRFKGGFSLLIFIESVFWVWRINDVGRDINLIRTWYGKADD